MATITKYLPTERLGSGPTCDVFVGRDVGGLNRRVAIKQLREDVRGHASRREAFFAAAQRWSQFEHEGLVTLFDLDRAEGSVIYEPHAQSGKQVIAVGGKVPAQAAEVLAQTAEALLYIHNQGLLHLNIKPSNVLFDSADRAKLIDGRCYERDRIGELPLPTGGQKYLAPEMIDPALGQIGPVTDIYCLGFVILEIMLGPAFDDLFRGVGVDAVDADRNWLRWHAAREEPLPTLSGHLPQLPPELERVLHRMLNKDPLQRYHTVVELLDELRPLLTATSSPREVASATPARSADSGIVPDRPRLAPTPATGTAEQPKLDDIPNRPAAPVVIRFLGCDAEMVGVNKDFFTLGDSAECDVQFPDALRSDGKTVLRLGRAAEGWRLNCPTGITYYVNQEVIASSANLRSGDIIRMTPGGPGFQFTILNQNAEPLSKLAARYAPRLVQPGSEPAPPKAAAPALVTAGNHHPRAASPAPPPRPSVAPAKPTAPPARPAAATAKSAAAPAPPARINAAPSRPTTQQPPRVAASQRFARLLDYKSWDKSTKNWVVLIAALVAMAIVIGLWPSGGTETEGTSPAPKAATNSVDVPSQPAPSETDGAPTQAPVMPSESGAS